MSDGGRENEGTEEGRTKVSAGLGAVRRCGEAVRAVRCRGSTCRNLTLVLSSSFSVIDSMMVMWRLICSCCCLSASAPPPPGIMSALKPGSMPIICISRGGGQGSTSCRGVSRVSAPSAENSNGIAVGSHGIERGLSMGRSAPTSHLACGPHLSHCRYVTHYPTSSPSPPCMAISAPSSYLAHRPHLQHALKHLLHHPHADIALGDVLDQLRLLVLRDHVLSATGERRGGGDR